MARVRYFPGQVVELSAARELHQIPLHQYLATRLSIALPLSLQVTRLAQIHIDGELYAGEEAVTLRKDARIRIQFPEDWPPHLKPVEMPLEILYEDEYFLAINKPAGIVVHPARGHMDNQTLQNGVLYRYRDTLRDPETSIGPPHRLDKDTTGALLFSRTRDAYRELVRQFSAGEVHKEYLLLTDGRADFDVTEVRAPLGVDPANPSRGAVVPLHEGGKEAVTEYYVIERGEDWSFLRAVPHTGRPHQVRLHAAYLGLPLMGDLDYNPNPLKHGMRRQALHAAVLRVRHPYTKKLLRFNPSFPLDMQEVVDTLRD